MRGRRRRRKATEKTSAVLAYNDAKVGIDLSDQMAAYANCMRKGIKWYRKLGMELLIGMPAVNAHVIYKEVTGKKIKITDFRKELAMDLLGLRARRPRPVIDIRSWTLTH